MRTNSLLIVAAFVASSLVANATELQSADSELVRRKACELVVDGCVIDSTFRLESDSFVPNSFLYRQM